MTSSVFIYQNLLSVSSYLFYRNFQWPYQKDLNCVQLMSWTDPHNFPHCFFLNCSLKISSCPLACYTSTTWITKEEGWILLHTELCLLVHMKRWHGFFFCLTADFVQWQNSTWAEWGWECGLVEGLENTSTTEDAGKGWVVVGLFKLPESSYLHLYSQVKPAVRVSLQLPLSVK